MSIFLYFFVNFWFLEKLIDFLNLKRLNLNPIQINSFIYIVRIHENSKKVRFTGMSLGLKPETHTHKPIKTQSHTRNPIFF